MDDSKHHPATAFAVGPRRPGRLPARSQMTAA